MNSANAWPLKSYGCGEEESVNNWAMLCEVCLCVCARGVVAVEL
jgi:hypothetical protein